MRLTQVRGNRYQAAQESPFSAHALSLTCCNQTGLTLAALSVKMHPMYIRKTTIQTKKGGA